MSVHHLVAVALAVAAAVLFGLAAVRQHGAVRATLTSAGAGLTEHLRTLALLARHPTWLVGATQGLFAGAAHVLALALAPISLVQPLGVLAVPVTVVAVAVTERQRPARAEVVGSTFSVLGIAALTLLLLAPASPVVLPSWGLLTVVLLVVLAGTALTNLGGTAGPPLLHCAARATGAAVLFGLNAVLIRTASHLLLTHRWVTELPLLGVSVVGMVVALVLGLWLMQTAYLHGSAAVVTCCLTLVDPLAAVLGGRLLLHDGVAVGATTGTAAVGCGVLAAVGIVLLARGHVTAAAER